MASPSGFGLTDELRESLRAAGLEPRDGVPGLFLLRDEDDYPIVPADGIKLEGETKVKAEAMRDELASLLCEKGVEAVPDEDLKGAWLVGATLIGAQLQGSDLQDAQLQKANLSYAQLQGSDLQDAQLQEAILRKAQLQEVLLKGAQLQKAVLKEAQLQKANLHQAQLQKANLQKAQLQEAILFKAQLQEAILTQAQLQKTNLSAANLKDANLNKAELQKAEIFRSQLEGANLSGANLRGANFSSTILTKANLAGAITTMINYKPPRPPTVRTKGAWRVKAVASSVGSALYQQLGQGDDDNEEDDDDGGSASEDDDDEEKAKPLEEQLEKLVEQAVESLVAVAEPVLALIGLMIAELENVCDKLSSGIPLVLVRLASKQTSPGKLQPDMVAEVLRTLLRDCLINPIFDEALMQMAAMALTQLEMVKLWAEGKAELQTRTMLDSLQAELQTIKEGLIQAQKSRIEDLTKGQPPQKVEQVGGAQPAADGAADANTGGDGRSDEPAALPAPALKQELRAFAAELLGALITELIQPLNDPEHIIRAQLKEPVLKGLDEFVEQASRPICNLLQNPTRLEDEQVAIQLLGLSEFLGKVKENMCKKVILKRVSSQLLGCVSTQSFGQAADKKLATAGMFEKHLAKKLDDKAKLLKRHLPLNGIRGRAFEAMLKTATKYNVRVGGFEGSVDMLMMAWRRSRVTLSTDENELQYLQDKLQKLEDTDSTANNWRDAAEGWISVLELRGKLRVQCGQSVLECMCGDEKILEALGAAKVLMNTEGEAPAMLVTSIAQGPGAHIRKHGYDYTKRLNKEIVLIRRVKELQMRAVAGLGTLLVATGVAVGNYFSRVMYDGVTNGFASQSWLTWALPFAAVAALIVAGFIGVAVHLCRKRIFWKTLRGCCSCRGGRSLGGKSARISPSS